MAEEKNQKQPLELTVVNAQGSHDKLVPKLCTSVFFQISGSKLILTLGYHEGEKLEKVTVIERVALDIPHAKSVSSSLQKAIEDFESKQKEGKEKTK